MKYLNILFLVVVATSCRADEPVLILPVEIVVAPPLGDICGWSGWVGDDPWDTVARGKLY